MTCTLLVELLCSCHLPRIKSRLSCNLWQLAVLLGFLRLTINLDFAGDKSLKLEKPHGPNEQYDVDRHSMAPKFLWAGQSFSSSDE